MYWCFDFKIGITRTIVSFKIISFPLGYIICSQLNINVFYLRRDKWQLRKEQKDSHNMHFWL